jgi:putative DNA primase/helicase
MEHTHVPVPKEYATRTRTSSRGVERGRNQGAPSSPHSYNDTIPPGGIDNTTGENHRQSSPVLPEDMCQRAQWVTWRAETRHQSDGTMKCTKIPYTPGTDRKAKSNDPTTWGTRDRALADVRAGKGDGIGFMFSTDDDFFGIDLDGVRNPETGKIESWTQKIIDQFDTYTEPSPSETGIHIIGRGVKPGKDCRKGEHIECYDRERFLTMTEAPLPGYTHVRDCQQQLTAWYSEIWTEREHNSPGPSPALTMDDEAIISLLNRETNGKARRLLTGDLSGYPSPSEARFALAQKVCYYTNELAQIARILRSSSLFKAGDSDTERERKATRDAEKAADRYTGPRYDPNFKHPVIVPQTTHKPLETDTGGVWVPTSIR